MREATDPLAEAGKRGAFLLQLTPGFSPRRNDVSELDPILDELGPLAVEFRHRGWIEGERRGEVLDHLRERGAVFVGVDAPRSEHFTILPPLDSVTNPYLAYLRCHGRSLDGYLRGHSVAERFDYDYPENELERIADPPAFSPTRPSRSTSCSTTTPVTTRRRRRGGCCRRSARRATDRAAMGDQRADGGR